MIHKILNALKHIDEMKEFQKNNFSKATYVCAYMTVCCSLAFTILLILALSGRIAFWPLWIPTGLFAASFIALMISSAMELLKQDWHTPPPQQQNDDKMHKKTSTLGLKKK